MQKIKGPRICLMTDGGPEVEIILIDENGEQQHLPKQTPAELLVEAASIDYGAYRTEVRRLWDEHPLFEESDTVNMEDFYDLAVDALCLPDTLKEVDPLSHFVLLERLRMFILQMKDNGSALFPLQTGADMIRILDEPLMAQIRMRNVFEIAFDDFERGTQRQRYEALEKVYPGLVNRFFPSVLVEETEGDIPYGNRLLYSLTSIFELYQLLLALYFKQNKQRIAKCERCWNYFIPKTKKQTLYCDRTFNGASCKQAGPNLKRNLGPEYDEALAIYNRIRNRMAERMDRYYLFGPTERLNPMDADRYYDWLGMAHQARTDYLDKKISSGEFLRRIDSFQVLDSHEAGKTEPVTPGDTACRKRVEHNIDFDPDRSFQTMQILDLSKGSDGAQWQYLTVEDQKRKARGGNESLMDRYEKEKAEESE